MVRTLSWLLLIVHFQGVCPISATSRTINSNGRIVRTEGNAGSSAPDVAAGVTVFIVTTPDEEHVTMLKNLLCSLFTHSGEAAGHQEISVLLHPGQGAMNMNTTAEELQQSLRNLGYSRLNVLNGQQMFGSHPHWKSLRHSFPSNLRVVGIRHLLARMPPGARLLSIDEDVVCSPERVSSSADVSVPDEIAKRAPAGAAVVCAHEVPGVSDVFNNGFCLYTASQETDALLAAVERRMVDLKFTGDQTPFNQVVSEGAELVGSGDVSDLTSATDESSTRKASDVVATFGAGTTGYLRTWTPDGFPHANDKDLSVVDSMAPEALVKWDKALLGPLCVHYLPFSPRTHVWSKLARSC